MHTAVDSPMLCYCLCDFHCAPACVVTVNYPYVFCSTCHVVAHIDLVGHHIAVAGSEGEHGGN